MRDELELCDSQDLEVIGRGHVRRHARPVGIGHAPFSAKFCLVVSGNEFSARE